MTNISTSCYDFIRENSNLFDLTRYDVDHSINFELLDNYVDKQTCSEKYFELLLYIYKQSTYIDVRTFMQHYIDNINELNEAFNDKEIIVIFPYLDVNKSNFFLTLYFLYLYESVLSKKINYVFPYKRKEKKTNIISISTLALTKEPLVVICDDFLYSGKQLGLTIANLPFICSESINIYTCIVGMTSNARQIFSKTNLIELGKNDYFDEEEGGEEEPINCMYDVIFPSNNLVIDKNLKTILRDKMISEGLYNNTIAEAKQMYDYIQLKDMYILENFDNKLYAVGQFSKLYYNLNNTLIYLFFKYPDLISTVLSMCILKTYSNAYTVSFDKILYNNVSIKKYPSNDSQIINKFEITQNLFEEPQDLEEIKQNIKNNIQIDINKFYWLEKCSDYKFNDVVYVNSDHYDRIQLINNLKKKFNSAQGSACNDSILTFYKQNNLIAIFISFSNLIKKIGISGGGRVKHYNINKKTNKKNRTRKSLKKQKKYIKNKTKKNKMRNNKTKQYRR
jgi:hypothetical protein